MDDSDESWELAEIDQFTIEVPKTGKTKEKMSIQDTKLKILHNILLIVEILKKPRKVDIFINKLNQYERLDIIKARFIEGENKNLEFIDSTIDYPGMFLTKINEPFKTNLFENEILFFLSCNLNMIPCRTYFVLGKEVQIFHEYVINNKVIENKTKFDGNCFSIDFNGNFIDQSFFHSKKRSFNPFYQKILKLIQEKTQPLITDIQNMPWINKLEIYKELDTKRRGLIPTNINKLKDHPLYIVEPICKYNEFIYPKRPVVGFINGIQVYPRNNLNKLRTEGGWARMGCELIVKDSKPYRIYNEKRLYAEFQIKPIVIEDLTGKIMNAFHENFTPKNCIRVYYNSEICKELGIKYSDCLAGFRGKEMVIDGFFIYKSDCFIVNHFIKEKEYYQSVLNLLIQTEESLNEWKELLKKSRKYLAIRKRIGM